MFKNWLTVYLISIKKILKRPLLYILIGISILCSVFVFIIAPLFLGGGYLKDYYDSAYWPTFCMEVSLVVVCLCSAFIGESNAINDEKIYFLSKSIKKNTFLLSKCLSSLTLSLLVTIIFAATLFGIFITGELKWGFSIFRLHDGVNALSIFGSFLAVTIFGSICGTIWKYQIRRGGMVAILCTLLLIVYIALFLLFSNNLSESDIDDKPRFWYLTCPIVIFFPLSLILGSLGFIVFNKKEVD